MIKRIDWHSHILPYIDDGSESVEESLQMLQVLASTGVEKVALTPHFYPDIDYPETFMARREESYYQLKAKLVGNEPELMLGAEVAYFDSLWNYSDVHQFMIQGTQCLLIELPYAKWNDRIFNNILNLLYRKNIIPILAHIDRYPIGRKELTMLQFYVEQGGLIQCNAEALLNKKMGKDIKEWLNLKLIHCFGSDCHNMTSRPPIIGEAFDWIDRKFPASQIQRINDSINAVFACK